MARIVGRNASMQTLDYYLEKAKHLPPAPRLVPQLLKLLGEPDTDSGEVVDMITHDPSLTTAVLRLCNSAYFAGATPAGSLQEAVTRIGFRSIYSLVVSISSVKTLYVDKAFGVSVDELWDHSVTTAVAAQIIAKDVGDNEHIAFTGGLLHDIGKLVFSTVEQDRYADVVLESEAAQSSLERGETKAFGFNHAEIGARLMARWQFPTALVASVGCHHHPAAANGFERFASYTYLGNMIAQFAGHGCGRQPFVFEGRGDAMKFLELSPERLSCYVIQTLEQLKTIQELLKIKA